MTYLIGLYVLKAHGDYEMTMGHPLQCSSPSTRFRNLFLEILHTPMRRGFRSLIYRSYQSES